MDPHMSPGCETLNELAGCEFVIHELSKYYFSRYISAASRIGLI